MATQPLKEAFMEWKCTHANMHTHTYIHLHTHIHTHISLYRHINTRKHAPTHTQACTQTQASTLTRKHADKHRHTQTCKHVQTQGYARTHTFPVDLFYIRVSSICIKWLIKNENTQVVLSRSGHSLVFNTKVHMHGPLHLTKALSLLIYSTLHNDLASRVG